MKSTSRVTHVVIELAVFLMVSAVGVVVYNAFMTTRPFSQSQRPFHDAQLEYYQIADRLQSDTEVLNQQLLKFAIGNDPNDWNEFTLKSQKLKDWLEQQHASSRKVKVIRNEPIPFTMYTSDLLNGLDRDFAAYQQSAQRLAEYNRGSSVNPVISLAHYEEANRQSRSLLAAGIRARAYGDAMDIFQLGSTQWFPRFRRNLFASLALGTIGWLTVVIYRVVFRSLRKRHLETAAIMERQKKFADLGELASSVAHEIRNPLTAINARLYTLQKSLFEGSAEHNDALVIRNEIGRLDRIVKDFLKLAGSAQPSLAPTSAGPVLSEIHDLLAPQLEKQSIQLKVEPAVDMPFRADADQLKQVLINLIQNAAESIGRDGTITLRAREGKVRLKGHARLPIIIEVEDTGPGIPSEVQEHLFEPFFSTKVGGTGLGLPISARIIGRHGGALNFRTEPNRGTTFCIVLPRADEK